MEEGPRNLREMLAEAKDTSELMVDLAYAALYFGDPDMADEVAELEERMSDLVQDMRAVCVMAVRDPKDSEGMSSVLQVVSATERIANDAVDIARIVTHRLGIPAQWWPTSARPRRCRTGCWSRRARPWPAGPWPSTRSRSTPA